MNATDTLKYMAVSRETCVSVRSSTKRTARIPNINGIVIDNRLDDPPTEERYIPCASVRVKRDLTM